MHSIHTASALWRCEVCLLFSCGRLVNTEQLALHLYNLVVHQSDLPYGQGWSPMPWQTLEGASSIPITLLEPVAYLDSDPILLKPEIPLHGYELVDAFCA